MSNQSGAVSSVGIRVDTVPSVAEQTCVEVPGEAGKEYRINRFRVTLHVSCHVGH
jgi:hypothetical protein